MSIPGIPDEHLERFHENYGRGRGALGYRHLPSGIVVYRICPPDIPHLQIDQELVAELKEKLRERGLLDDREHSS
jgi:hypothetical protein